MSKPHVDDWLDQPPVDLAEAYAQAVIEFMRLPAITQCELSDNQMKRLYCSYRGERWAVTHASTMGDIGLSKEYQRHGYEIRASISKCSNWSHEPTGSGCEAFPKMGAIEFVNFIFPRHDRTSCSDENPNNGFFVRNGDSWHGRCKRCMSLEIIENWRVPNDYDQDEFDA